MNIFSIIKDRILKLTRKLGIVAPLSFDQQVWGAKSVMDLVQHGSKFLLADGVNQGDCYTVWSGAKDGKATAIVIDSSGHATGPFPDDSRTKDCQPWQYPPKVTCAQAVHIMVQSGITETWTKCTLQQITGQKNPAYTFIFTEHAPVVIDAVTGKII
jgi:hypothetical protein